MALMLNNTNFQTEVVSSPIPVIVDFWAPWCRPCQMLGPTIEQLHTELEGKVKVGKVNVDENEELAMRFGISTIPSIILFRDGKPVKKVVGLMRKEDLLRNLGL